MNTVTLDELMDGNSDFYVTRLVATAVANGRDVLAGGIARKAAHEGMEALAIIERRGSDDLEMFIGE